MLARPVKIDEGVFTVRELLDTRRRPGGGLAEDRSVSGAWRFGRRDCGPSVPGRRRPVE